MKYRTQGLLILVILMPIFSACFRSIPQTPPGQVTEPQIPTKSNPPNGNTSILLKPSPTILEYPGKKTSESESLRPAVTQSLAPTLQSTPTLAVTLPPIETAASSYTLTHPSAATLAHIQLSRSSQFLYSNTSIDALLYPTFHTILDYEWENAYTPGTDFDQIFPMIPNFYDHSQGRLTNAMIMDVIGDYVVSHLNQQSYSLENQGVFTVDKFSVRSYRVEIDGDALPEWLIQIQNPDGYYLGEDSFWAALDQNIDNQYLRIESQIPWQYGFSSIEKPEGILTDLTGDGLTDVAIVEQTPQAGGAHITFHIAQGSPQGFFLITPSIEIETSDLPGTSNEIFEWAVPPGKEMPFLRVQSQNQSAGWPCETETITEYRWAGAIFQVLESEPRFPGTTDCAIMRGLEEGSKSDYSKAIQWMETALQHRSDLSSEEQVFVLYRLALNQLIVDQYEGALTNLKRIAEMDRSDSTEIAQALRERVDPLITQGTLTPFRLCLAAESLSTIDTNTPWDPLTGIHSYPYTGYPQGYPTPLCDTYQFQVEYLNARFLEPKASLPADLKAEGFPFLSALELSPSDPESNWLLLIEDNDPNLIFNPARKSQREPDKVISILGYVKSRWEPIFSSPLGEPNYYNFSDLSGDGIIDFGFAQPALNPDWNPCENDQIPYDIFVITALEKGWLIPFSDSVCLTGDEVPEFASILADTNHDGKIDLIANTLEAELFDLNLLAETNGPGSIPPNWYRLLYRTSNLDYLLTELANQVLSVNDPVAIRSDINVYLNRFQPNSELDRYILAELTYLSALQYEITGDFENARNQYYQIWQAFPDTLWAHLASTRFDSEE